MKAYWLCAAMLMSASLAHAEPSDKPCPPLAQSQMDDEFGAGTAAQTLCLQDRKNVKSVVNVSSAAVNKTGVGQQIVNVKNMVDNYSGMYDMRVDEDYHIVVVAHGAGGRWLLTDDAYNRTYAVTTGNPSRATVEALLQKGVRFFMCQNTMRGLGWKTEDLIPGVKQVPAGVTAVVDFAKEGYVPLTP